MGLFEISLINHSCGAIFESLNICHRHLALGPIENFIIAYIKVSSICIPPPKMFILVMYCSQIVRVKFGIFKNVGPFLDFPDLVDNF